MKVEFAVAGPGAGPGQRNVEVKVRRILIEVGVSAEMIWSRYIRHARGEEKVGDVVGGMEALR